jgi:hypothetical protein
MKLGKQIAVAAGMIEYVRWLEALIAKAMQLTSKRLKCVWRR